ncbi:MAG: RepB family DNA primase [Gemmatimonadota bacterium]|nr:RepB family DNA primase [Gemmatimonadota bacterium]
MITVAMMTGFFITLTAIRRQLAAMPNQLYLVRPIHAQSGRPCAGERLWSAGLLTRGPAVGFLRARNCEGFDIYLSPFTLDRNTGYILVDLDRADPQIIHTMRSNGHEPCVVLQTSPGNLQAWVQVSATPLEPAVATEIGAQLARLYRGDPASVDWRHLGRLAGFTNQKPQRRCGDYAPWVKLLHAQAGLATNGAWLVEAAQRRLPDRTSQAAPCSLGPPDRSLTARAAAAIYQAWLNRLRIPQRFPQTDWSIADKWIAKELLWRRTPVSQVQAILQLGSPGFPRRHSNPDDYLRRTAARALAELESSPFPGLAPLAPRHDSSAVRYHDKIA